MDSAIKKCMFENMIENRLKGFKSISRKAFDLNQPDRNIVLRWLLLDAFTGLRPESEEDEYDNEEMSLFLLKKNFNFTFVFSYSEYMLSVIIQQAVSKFLNKFFF
jgi:hypothetical protein